MPTLSEITQQYNRDQDAKAWQRTEEARALMELLERNAKAEGDRILGEQRWSVVALDPFQRSAAIAEAHEKAREIPVTEEMLAAANAVWNAAVDGEPLSMDLYRAMAAVAPVELVSATEDRIAALEAELVGKNSRIAELKSELAAIQVVTSKPTASQTTPGDIQPTAAPKTFPAGALKPSQSDPRRVGG